MKIIPVPNLQKVPFPLPLYDSAKIAEAIGEEGNKFSIFAGVNKEFTLELKKLSLDDSDTDLQENTSDRKRLGEGSYEDWYKKRRTPFLLIDDKTNSIAAISWFGPKPLGRKSTRHLTNEELKEEEKRSPYSGNWHTISYRCYPRFRGKKLMKDFVSFVMDIYMKSFPDAQFWAGIKTGNAASDKLAQSLGFEPAPELSDPKANWLVMIKK